MSVRAYRINKIDYENDSSFNLWHDEKLMNFLDENYGCYDTLIEGTGIMDLQVEALEKALENKTELNLDKWIVKMLKKDIKWAKEKGGYIQYYCL